MSPMILRHSRSKAVVYIIWIGIASLVLCSVIITAGVPDAATISDQPSNIPDTSVKKSVSRSDQSEGSISFEDSLGRFRHLKEEDDIENISENEEDSLIKYGQFRDYLEQESSRQEGTTASLNSWSWEEKQHSPKVEFKSNFQRISLENEDVDGEKQKALTTDGKNVLLWVPSNINGNQEYVERSNVNEDRPYVYNRFHGRLDFSVDPRKGQENGLGFKPDFIPSRRSDKNVKRKRLKEYSTVKETTLFFPKDEFKHRGQEDKESLSPGSKYYKRQSRRNQRNKNNVTEKSYNFALSSSSKRQLYGGFGNIVRRNLGITTPLVDNNELDTNFQTGSDHVDKANNNKKRLTSHQARGNKKISTYGDQSGIDFLHETPTNTSHIKYKGGIRDSSIVDSGKWNYGLLITDDDIQTEWPFSRRLNSRQPPESIHWSEGLRRMSIGYVTGRKERYLYITDDIGNSSPREKTYLNVMANRSLFEEDFTHTKPMPGPKGKLLYWRLMSPGVKTNKTRKSSFLVIQRGVILLPAKIRLMAPIEVNTILKPGKIWFRSPRLKARFVRYRREFRKGMKIVIFTFRKAMVKDVTKRGIPISLSYRSHWSSDMLHRTGKNGKEADERFGGWEGHEGNVPTETNKEIGYFEKSIYAARTSSCAHSKMKSAGRNPAIDKKSENDKNSKDEKAAYYRPLNGGLNETGKQMEIRGKNKSINNSIDERQPALLLLDKSVYANKPFDDEIDETNDDVTIHRAKRAEPESKEMTNSSESSGPKSNDTTGSQHKSPELSDGSFHLAEGNVQNSTSLEGSIINPPPPITFVNMAILAPMQEQRLFTIQRTFAAIEIALQKVIDEVLVPPHVELVPRFGNSYCSISDGMNAAIEFYARGKVDVFLGPVCDYAVAPVARQSRYWRIPVLTPGAMAAHFGFNKHVMFPYLTRLGPNFNSLLEVILAITDHYHWNKIKLLYQPNEFMNVADRYCHIAMDGIVLGLLRKGSHVTEEHSTFHTTQQILDNLHEEIGTDRSGRWQGCSRGSLCSILVLFLYA